MRTEAKMPYEYLMRRPTVGRSSTDRKSLQLIKVIGEVYFNVIAPVGRQNCILSVDENLKFLSADYRPIVIINVIAAKGYSKFILAMITVYIYTLLNRF